MNANRPALESLPNEIIQRIGFLIDDDEDLAHLICASRKFAGVLHGKDSPLWRQRYLRLYDRPSWLQADNWKYQVMVNYQHQSSSFRTRPSFRLWPNGDSLEWLECIAVVLLEAYPALLPGRAVIPSSSKNLALLRDVLQGARFFDRCTYGWQQNGRGISHDNYDAVQLALTPFALDLGDLGMNVSSMRGRLDYDIARMYPVNTAGQYLFAGPVNAIHFGTLTLFQRRNPRPGTGCFDLFTLLQIRNFWKRHLCFPGERTYYKEYKSSPKPQLFDGTLVNGFKPLKRRWEGFWANRGPLYQADRAINGDQIWMEEMDEKRGKPPYMWIDLAFSPPEDHWFVKFIRRFPRPEYHTAIPDRIFTGHGRDINGRFAVAGLLTPDNANGGILGWQHVWMFKHYVHPAGFVKLAGDIRVDAVRFLGNEPTPDMEKWIFQGAVLPGGKVALGFWDLQPTVPPQPQGTAAGESGPWIMWWAEETPEWLEKTAKMERKMEEGDLSED